MLNILFIYQGLLSVTLVRVHTTWTGVQFSAQIFTVLDLKTPISFSVYYTTSFILLKLAELKNKLLCIWDRTIIFSPIELIPSVIFGQ